MIYLINFNIKWLNYIVMNKFKIIVPNPVFDIPLSSGKEIVDDDNLYM